MASEFLKKTSTPGRLLSRIKMKSQSLLPSLFQREKCLKKKEEASTGGQTKVCSLPRIGPLLDKSETGRKPLPSKPVTTKKNLFQVSPQEIVFQNFLVHQVSEMILYLTTKGKSSRSVRVTMENSPHFRLAGSNDAYRRVRPGARHIVRIQFTPDENKDYFHELSCTSGTQSIVVPIRAIGGRPILDFPDQLDFPVCVVKCSSEKILLVQNTGNLEAHYEMSTQSPFSVVPARGTLGIGETMEVTVKYQPLRTGDHDAPLVVCYGRGETTQTKLHGEAVDLNIGLSTYSVELEKTYITLSCHTTVVIKNRSDTTTHFQWKTYPNEEEENRKKTRLNHLHGLEKGVWLENLLAEKNVMEELGTCEDRTAILSNMIDEEMAKVQQDPMLFSDDVFFIEPLEGEIGPNCSAKIKVTFKPQEVLEYRSVAYCNISGHEIRLPLKLRGEGKGLEVELSCDTLNLGNVYVNTTHAYEVDLINKSLIDAPFTFVPPTAHVANCFEFEPRKGIIAPGERQTIQISFKATLLGMFDEEFQFSVAGSPMPAALRIKGCIDGPNLHVDVKEINFGDIAFGLPYTKNFRLTNASPASLTFKLRIPDDGSGPVVSCYDQMRNNTDPSWRKGIDFSVKPKEFTMTPSQGTILPQGHQDIEVTLCSNTVMEYYQYILVDVEGIGEGVLALTVMGRCIVPKLTAYPYVLCYDECHPKEPYERKFLVVNNSHIPGCYGLIAQKHEEDTPVFYSSSEPCGIVQPFSVAEIPVTIEAQKLGKYDTNVLIGVFGDEGNPLRQVLRSTGTRADIYPSPRLIEVGMITALHRNTHTFHLVNEGLVAADFRMKITRKPNIFTIDPSEGAISPRSEILVTVTAILNDTGLFADEVELFIGDSLLTTFTIMAWGIGTTIVADKPFAPEINLGYQFSLIPCFRQFKFTNAGYHFHQLYWTVKCYSPPEEEAQSLTSVSSSENEEDSQSPKRTPLFQLQPRSVELQPGESAEVVVQGFSSVPQVVQNYVLCEAIIGESTTTQPITATVITCEFIHPSIEVSAKEFFFRVEKKPSDELTLQYQPLSLKNTCALPLDLLLYLEQPFMVCDADQQPLPFGQPVTVDVGETSHLYIAFDPAYELDFHSWEQEKVLMIDMVRGHPYKEYITLRGEVHFPNLLIQPNTLEFGCIKAGTEEVLSLEITNNSLFPVKYHWSFHVDSQVNKLRYESCPPKFQPHPPKEKRTRLDGLTPQHRRFRVRNVEVPSPAIKESQRLARQKGLKGGTEVTPYTCENSNIPLGLSFRCTELYCNPIPVDQAFKILPLSGELQPGESQQVTFSFFGHLNSIARVTALCNVEGGPSYDVDLTGEASRISYFLSVQEINCGIQMFNEIQHSKVVLANTGKIPFDWVLNPSTDTADQALDGVFTVKPSSGSIRPGERKELKFSYLPGLPGAFCRTYELKVADMDPENICLKGKASFPITSINLPWNIKGNENYDEALKELIKFIQQYKQKDKSLVWEKAETLKAETLMIQNLKSHMHGSGTVWDTWIQKKLVKKLIRQAALELQRTHTSRRPKTKKLFPDKDLRQNLVNIDLPEYILDMGAVLKGHVEKRTVEISNPGSMAVSLQVDQSVLQDTGFRVNLEKVTYLPQRCATSFEVRFESACQPLGEVDVVLPITVTKGPTRHIHLRAKVFGLSLDLSKNRFQFHDTIVGQCQVETVRLYNWFRVPCEWFISEVKPEKKPFLPPIRPKLKDRLKETEEEPCPFKVKPSRGIIGPGKWQNVEIQFAPKEERSYRNELKVNICGSSNYLKLYLSGQGLESRLEFSPPALKMGWVLVGSNWLEATVVVKNPCKFPIEFYSLDFDEQYLEEEKILRTVVGSKYPKTFLMPARAVGETLPPEVLEDYKAREKLKAQQAELKVGAEAEAQAMGKAAPAHQGTVAFCPEPLVKAVRDPISRAVMRHMGMEPSSDEAQQCRGIVVIVHGAPRAGKSVVAAALCQYYNVEYLSIDAVVKKAITDGSEAGLRARELCTKAAEKLEDKDKRRAGKKSKLAVQTNKKQEEKIKGNTKGENPSAQKKKKAASTPKKKDPKVTVSTAPAPQPLNISSSSGEELNCLSCVLPEDLLVDILSERLKHKDCYKGVIFDGLESLFASSLESSLLCVLKAVKNRRHIYIVNLHQDYASCKATEEAERQEEEWQQNEAHQNEVKRLLVLDDNEDDEQNEAHQSEVKRLFVLDDDEDDEQNEAHQSEVKRLLVLDDDEDDEQNEAHQTEVKRLLVLDDDEDDEQNEAHQSEVKRLFVLDDDEDDEQNEAHQSEVKRLLVLDDDKDDEQNEAHQSEVKRLLVLDDDEDDEQNEAHQSEVKRLLVLDDDEDDEQNEAHQSEVKRLLVLDDDEDDEQNEAHQSEVKRLLVLDDDEDDEQNEAHQSEVKRLFVLDDDEDDEQNEAHQSEGKRLLVLDDDEDDEQNEAHQSEVKHLLVLDDDEDDEQNEAHQNEVKRLLVLDDDEDDDLPEEKKAEADGVILERKQIQRERELKQLAQKLEESKDLEDEEKLEEEKEDVSLVKQPAKPQKGETKHPEKETKHPEMMVTKTLEKWKNTALRMWETIIPEKGKTKDPEKKETKHPEMKVTKTPEKWKNTALSMWETIIPEKGETIIPEKEETKSPKKGKAKIPAEMKKNLILRFQIYESSQQNVTQVYSCWDRVEGTLQLPVLQKENKSQPSAEQKDQMKTSRPQEKVEKKPAQKYGGHSSLQSSQLERQSEVAEGAVRDKHVGVPCLDIQVTNMDDMLNKILKSGRLPTGDQMLKHLGLHPDGPPLPPTAVLSIVNYPEERSGSVECVKPFTIVAPEGAAVEDDLAETPDAKGSSAEGQPKTDKVASKDKSPEENQISTQSPQDPSTRPKSSSEAKKSMLPSVSLPTEFVRLKRYRWIVPAKGEVELKVRFCPTKSGKFHQTLRFELVGMKHLYKLPCSGTGLYPSISQYPRLVFPQWRETIEDDEIIFKEYVESTKQFHFGPLLCGKSREWYKAQNFPGNSENITILNISPMEVEVHFSFGNEKGGETFLLDPPSMTLQPKEKQELTIWAYPTSSGFLEDKLICCIEKNPNPVVFSLCCHGVLMKLEVIPQELSFDKLLLHRTDSRTLVLKNNALLPMAWQFSGLDDLVEDFSLSQENGIIDPCSELEVTLNFTARQIGSIEKTLRLEVSDTENILGIVHAENIKISAEVSDVSLSIDMPEGPDGSLEFGTINVLDNLTKVLSLKNKGSYDMKYSFTLKGAGPRMRDLVSHFSIEPQSGMLIASQPGVNVKMLFHPTNEILLKNTPILYCQVIDARSGEGGQIVANIPVRVSAEAVYSKYSIQPASPINFGAIVKGTRKTQTVILENKGMLSFKFRILQAPKDAPALQRESSKQGESALLAPKRSVGRRSSAVTQGHLSLGTFTVSPCSGSIAPWGQQKITVECFAGQERTCEEHVYFDITNRDPMDNPLGIPFTLTAESCFPALVEDVTLIFKKYPICSSTNLSHELQSVKSKGLFIRDKNKFIFCNVLVGQQAEAHFNIYSASSLSCDVVLSIKPLHGKDKSPVNNIFKLHPVRLSVPGSSYAVATVTFTPQEERNYDCTFKASLVVPKSPVKINPQHLTFTISGRGHEPQVTVVCPSARSRRGNAVLRFKRLQLGDSEMLPLVIRNNGIIPVQFMLQLEDEQGVFFLKARKATLERFHSENVEEDSIENVSKHPKMPFLLLRHGQVAEFDVIFKPTLAQRLEGSIHVLLGNIYSNKIRVELVGEGHKDEFTLDGLEEDPKERNAKSSVKKNIIDAVRVNHIQFGDCHVGKPYCRTFTITNRTHTKVMCFEWEADAPFRFSPKVGHLHPGCAKSITVTLKSDVPATFRRHLVKCKVAEINFELPQTKVEDWDDGMRVVTWKDTTRKLPGARWPENETVVETVPELAYTVVEESSREAEVYLSALVAYAEFKLSRVVVWFNDTFPFQSRTATFTMHNTGKVALEYSWVEGADSEEAVKKPYSKTLMRKFLSSDIIRHCRKLLHHFWRQQKHPSEVLEQQQEQQRLAKLLAKQNQDSEEQQQQDSKEQDFEEKQQQDFEEQQQDPKEEDSKKEDFKDFEEQDFEEEEQDFEEEEQDSEEQQQDPEEEDSKKEDFEDSEEQDFEEEEQDSEEQQQDPEEEDSKKEDFEDSEEQDFEEEEQDSEEQQQDPEEEDSKKEDFEDSEEQDFEEEEQDSEEQQQDPEEEDSKKEDFEDSEEQDSEEQDFKEEEQNFKEQQQDPEEEDSKKEDLEEEEHYFQEQQQPSKQQQKLRLSRQKHLSLQHAGSSLQVFPDVVHDLFSINPSQGTIAPGHKQTFHVRFSPECVGKFKTIMQCRIPNLKPTQKKARVIVKGKAQEQTEKSQGPKKQVHWKPTPQ